MTRHANHNRKRKAVDQSSLATLYGRSAVPLYLQVAAALRRRIEDGYWQPSEKISTLQELEDEFQVARVTVRQAVEMLQNEGLVERKQGKGTFVTENVSDKRWLRLDLKWSSLVAAIKANVPKFIDVENPSETVPVLSPEEGRLAPPYVHLRSVQLREGEPYGLASVHVAKSIFDMNPKAFTTQPAISVLASMEEVEIATARQSFIIGTADTTTADLLEVALNFPTAEARLVITDRQGNVIYGAEIVYRGDCVRLDINLLD